MKKPDDISTGHLEESSSIRSAEEMGERLAEARRCLRLGCSYGSWADLVTLTE